MGRHSNSEPYVTRDDDFDNNLPQFECPGSQSHQEFLHRRSGISPLLG